VTPPSQDLVIIGDELKRRVALETYKDIQEAFRFTDTNGSVFVRSILVLYNGLNPAQTETMSSIGDKFSLSNWDSSSSTAGACSSSNVVSGLLAYLNLSFLNSL
jgi:hypothetical protein